jgi:hypothetical protein
VAGQPRAGERATRHRAGLAATTHAPEAARGSSPHAGSQLHRRLGRRRAPQRPLDDRSPDPEADEVLVTRLARPVELQRQVLRVRASVDEHVQDVRSPIGQQAPTARKERVGLEVVGNSPTLDVEGTVGRPAKDRQDHVRARPRRAPPARGRAQPRVPQPHPRRRRTHARNVSGRRCGRQASSGGSRGRSRRGTRSASSSETAAAASGARRAAPSPGDHRRKQVQAGARECVARPERASRRCWRRRLLLHERDGRPIRRIQVSPHRGARHVM